MCAGNSYVFQVHSGREGNTSAWCAQSSDIFVNPFYPFPKEHLTPFVNNSLSPKQRPLLTHNTHFQSPKFLPTNPQLYFFVKCFCLKSVLNAIIESLSDRI